jgi:hypothetical protein
MITGPIVQAASEELPQTWKKLSDAESGFGTAALERRVKAVMDELFGEVLSAEEQAELDSLVVEYAAKLIALKLITPGIDFWSKQPTSAGATGRNEQKSYPDRAAALKDLRKQLLEETREMWPSVEPLVPLRRRRIRGPVPVVSDVVNAHTPDPHGFEPLYGPPETI